MLSKVSEFNMQDKEAAEEVTNILQRAKDIRDDAIDYALSKLPSARQDKDLLTLSQRKDFLPHFKCGLAKGVGDFLTENDEQVKEIYLFEPDANPDIESGVFEYLDRTVHLLVLVGASSAALGSLTTALDRALTQSLKESKLVIYAEYWSVLDIITITDEDVRLRRGFATLLSSIFTPPIRVC